MKESSYKKCQIIAAVREEVMDIYRRTISDIHNIEVKTNEIRPCLGTEVSEDINKVFHILLGELKKEFEKV